MSEETTVTETLVSKTPPLVLISVSVAAIMVALLALVSFILLLVIASDVSHLQDQVGRLTRSNKVIAEELAALKTLRASPPAAPAAAPTPAAPRPTHIDAGDAAQDCVIRPGSKNPLAGCLQ